MSSRKRPRSRWRRHRRNRRLLACSFIFAGAVAVWADTQGTARTDPGMAVTYAVRSLSSRAVIADDDIATTDVDPGSPLAAAGLPPDAVIGRTAIGDVAAGEMLTSSRLTDDSARPGFAAMAVAFSRDDLTEFLTAGTRIDIIWSPDDFSDRPAEVVTRDARVLKVTPSQAPDRVGAASSVLLEVTEADAVRLAAAMHSGSLSVLSR